MGTHTGAANASVLTDSYADFLRAGVIAGMIIYNYTDGSEAIITGVTQTTITGTLAGGADNDWDVGDKYLIVAPLWIADPEVLHSVSLEAASRLLSMRGSQNVS